MYIKSKRNQLANASNRFQGDAIKALCICSAGLLRSPSIAKFLTEKGFNTRACGTSMDYALIPLSSALIEWADEIHVVKEELNLVLSVLKELEAGIPIYSYNIPDNFGTFSEPLMTIIEEEYSHSLTLV
jgi:predicted protein tyrosine phosphatase